MRYIGKFSFDEVGVNQELRHGYFTCLVSAVDVTEAFRKFKTRILQIKEENHDNVFFNIARIFVEDVIEIEDFPEDAILISYQSSEGKFPKSESHFLPISQTSKIRSYQWQPEEAGINIKDENGYKEAVPFMQF